MASTNALGLVWGAFTETVADWGKCFRLVLTESSCSPLGHVDKWRSQRRIDVMSMNPRKLSAVLS